MSDPDEGRRAERKTDRWHYTLDMTTAPAYGVCMLEGEPAQDMIERVAADLLRLMDALVGQEAPFCPLIIDLRKVTAGKMGISTFQWASSRAMRRITRLLAVFDADLLTRTAHANFMRLASVAMPHIEIVYSMDEALERLGQDEPPGAV